MSCSVPYGYIKRKSGCVPHPNHGGDLRGLGQRHRTGLHAKIKKEKILIPEEWLLYPFKEAEVKDVPELLEYRKKVLLPV